MYHCRNFAIAATAVILLLAGCSKTDNPVTPDNGSDKLKFGTLVDAGSTAIGTAGGTITVSQSGSPINGMQIIIPTNAYPEGRTFSISYAPIESHKFGSDFNPISPLITIENGGGYTDSPMVLRIPAHVGANEFAMAFNFDQATGQLEGLPVVACDTNGVTVMLHHFAFNTLAPRAAFGKRTADVPWAQIVLSKIENSLLQGEITSGFTPGVDDWEFTNYGSFPAMGGICAGMSFTAMYYYDMIKPRDHANLWQRYDSVHTPDMWIDNARGIKLATMAHIDYSTSRPDGESFWMNNFIPIANTWYDQYRAFAYALRLTHQPQHVYVCGADGAHAMVVYKVNNNVMSVSDPNIPGNTTRVIIFDPATKRFVPYFTGLTAASPGHSFGQIYYIARAAVVGWDKIGLRWQQFESGTVGNDGCFPAYTLWVKDGSGYELADGLNTDNDTLPIQLRCPTCPDQLPDSLYFEVYDGAGTLLETSGAANTGVVKLDPGKNRFGIVVMAKAVRACNGNLLKENGVGWVDFKWFNVTRAALKIESATHGGAPFLKSGKLDTTYTLRASLPDKRPADPRYEWKFGDGSSDITVHGDSTVQHRFVRSGQCTVSVKLLNNATGISVAEATAVATIGGAAILSRIIPDSVSWGGSAEVRGTGFGATQGTSVLNLDGPKNIDITLWCDSIIRFNIPDSASGGWVRVVVNGVMSNQIRYYVRSPRIDSISPPHGKAGTVVRLIGKGFGQAQRNSIVKFAAPNDTVLPATFWSDTLIITRVPSNVSSSGNFNATFTVYQKGTRNSNGKSWRVDRDWLRTVRALKSATVSWISYNTYTGGGVAGCINTYINVWSTQGNGVVWQDSAFTASFTETSNGSTTTVSITGTVSSSGEILSTVRGRSDDVHTSGTGAIRKSMTFTTVPLDTTTSNSGTVVYVIKGSAAQSHASQLEDYFNNGSGLETALSGTDWNNPACSTEVRLGFN